MIEKELSKMTKKEKREYYNQFRNTWKLNPVTRKTTNAKAYNRKKSRSENYISSEWDFYFNEKKLLHNMFIGDRIIILKEAKE